MDDLSGLFDNPLGLNLTDLDISNWDVSNVTNMNRMFVGTQFNGDISNWDVSKVTNMSYMFHRARFNGDISNWDVSSVVSMERMFQECFFDGNISNWNVSSVTNMYCMFKNSSFNSDISRWNVSSVTDMSSMFESSQFNGNISNWDVSNVVFMYSMFKHSHFNGDISRWNVSSVTDMKYMFFESIFNDNISNWNVSSVSNMSSMFENSQFNSDISNWNVSSVTNMYSMFRNSPFNGNISTWNVSNVTNMSNMFKDSLFNSDISGWNVSNVRIMASMFDNTPFTGNISGWQTDPNVLTLFMFRQCPIPEENKPRFANMQQPQQPLQPQVNPNQIHRASAKINYKKLNDFFKLSNIEEPFDTLEYSVFIGLSLHFMVEITIQNIEEKKQLADNVKRILIERLGGIKYNDLNPEVRNSIYYTLSYVLLQSRQFKEIYITSFTNDCINAYNGQNPLQNMTCAAGALERMIFSLLPASLADESMKEKYGPLVSIISANPSVLIPQYIQDWYKLHKKGGENEFPPIADEEERKNVRRNNLKDFLKSFFSEPENEALINEKIAEIADNIGYDDDDFDLQFGGGRRRIRQHKKKRTTRKRQ
jgi:surface protein